MIDVSNVDFVAFLQKAYELSSPQGMGHIHYRPGPLSVEEATLLVKAHTGPQGGLSFDYVFGRAVKLCIYKKGERYTIEDSWFDHSDAQLAELRETFNI